MQKRMILSIFALWFAGGAHAENPPAEVEEPAKPAEIMGTAENCAQRRELAEPSVPTNGDAANGDAEIVVDRGYTVSISGVGIKRDFLLKRPYSSAFVSGRLIRAAYSCPTPEKRLADCLRGADALAVAGEQTCWRLFYTNAALRTFCLAQVAVNRYFDGEACQAEYDEATGN
ncbi:hypothetical protein [Roseateles paludis]|jgi:hypothetical protein|uniref:Uncharacterized protein n=1 Tax=Roseateles paludis TaxID=3145238 RepID=A0ABV0FY62_9BURK